MTVEIWSAKKKTNCWIIFWLKVDASGGLEGSILYLKSVRNVVWRKWSAETMTPVSVTGNLSDD